MSNVDIKAFLNKIAELAGGFDVTAEMIEETKTFLSSKKENKEKKDKKEKKEKKDPNAPKKPTNAYMIYAKEMRQTIAEETEITDSKALVKEIARRWNEEKKNDSAVYKKYTQKLIDAKEQYNSDMENYSSSSDESESPKVAPKKKDAPKKPESPKAVPKKVEDEDDIPEPPKKAEKKSVEKKSAKKTEVAKKTEEDEDEIPEPPKKKGSKK